MKRWAKLAHNVPWNAICALTRCDDGNFLRATDLIVSGLPNAEDMIVKIMLQVCKVAAAEGYHNVNEELNQRQLDLNSGLKVNGGRQPSMLTDNRHGLPIEVEAILGNLLRIAQKHNIEVPYIELLYTLTQGLNFSSVMNVHWLPTMLIT